MAQVHINNIIVGNNPATVLDPFSFDITFECFKEMPGIFDWKIVYIGSPNNTQYDQTIESFDMANLSSGIMEFHVDTNPPDFSLIPQEEIIGTTAIIISVAYEKQEFFRCGYYIRNQYDQNMLEIPKNVNLHELKRYILNDNPRIFRFEIEWIKHEGEAMVDNELLQKNLQIMGGDPFESSNGALQQLEQMHYSYGMFQNKQAS